MLTIFAPSSASSRRDKQPPPPARITTSPTPLLVQPLPTRQRLHFVTPFWPFPLPVLCGFVDIRKSLPITTTSVQYLHPNLDYSPCWQTSPKRSCLLSHSFRLCCLSPIGRGTCSQSSLFRSERASQRPKSALQSSSLATGVTPRSPASFVVLESQNKLARSDSVFVSSFLRILVCLFVLCTRWISRSPIITRHQSYFPRCRECHLFILFTPFDRFFHL